MEDIVILMLVIGGFLIFVVRSYKTNGILNDIST